MLQEVLTSQDTSSTFTDMSSKSSSHRIQKKPKIAFYTILTLFVAFICSDFFLHKNYMLASCDLSSMMQESLTKAWKIISFILSGPMTYWVVPFLSVLPLITDNYVTTLYYYFLYFGQIAIVVLLKASYGRGRPAIIGKDVAPYACSCDYGMPSGHSSSSFMGYIILIDYFDRCIFKIYQKDGAKNMKKSLRILVHAYCYLMVLFICWSRIYLGAHSFNQVIYGLSTSAVFYLFFTRDTFEIMLAKMNTNIVMKVGWTMIILNPVIVYIYFLVMKKRTQPDYWKYWNRCQICEGTFAYKQTQNLAILFSLPGFFIGFAYGVSFAKSKLENHIFAKKTKSTHAKRFGILFLVLMIYLILTFIVVSIIPYFQSKPKSQSSKYIARTIATFIPIIGSFYSLSFSIHILFLRFNVSYPEDFYCNCSHGMGVGQDDDGKITPSEANTFESLETFDPTISYRQENQ